MNKNGLEIGINFLIILILVIVIFGFGFAIFSRMFERASDFQNTIDQGTQRQIDQLLDSGEPVSIPRIKATIDPTESEIFHIGINNEITNPSGTEFVLVIEQSDSTLNPSLFNMQYDDSPFILEEGGRKYMPFMIEATGGVEKGTYIFNVVACYKGGNTASPEPPCKGSHPAIYYQLYKIYLNVR